MGTYVVYCCHECRQYIDPAEINEGACKLAQVGYRNDLGRLLLHLLDFPVTLPRWTKVTMVVDVAYGWDTIHEEYENVTKLAIDSFNQSFPDVTPLRFVMLDEDEIETEGVEIVREPPRLH